MATTTFFSTLLFLVISLFAICAGAEKGSLGDKYLLGVGKADITGPVVEVNFAGYANAEQQGTGLRQRIYSRAFIIADHNKPDDRFVYIVIDAQSGDTAVRYGVLDGLKALGPDYAVYGQQNIALTGTHSHSGPGGWFNYLLPQFTSYGFEGQSYEAIVEGVVRSIERAHQSLQEGFLDIGTTKIPDGAINRSPYAYMQNPKKERDKYDAETDTTMTLLRFRRLSDMKTIGVLSWFPVHGTSMVGNNTHVTGDNKGVAAWLLEDNMMKDKNSVSSSFVAGFSQSNVGDTTPNVGGAFCTDGTPCSFERSTCADGKSQKCHGRGPFDNSLDLGVKSCFEMGRRQFAGALRIIKCLDEEGIPVRGPTVKSFHFYNDMRYFKFTRPDDTIAQTCPAALGYSFAAGTSDWPGAFDFTQGDHGQPDANPLWRIASALIKEPDTRQKNCQEPKPILLDVGELEKPYAWAPNIVDMQMLRVGQLFFIISPSEATTMSGRRWRNAVAAEAASFMQKEPAIVVLGGPANSYAHYLATPEEYDVQRYEGASTLYGRNTLDAYIYLTVNNMHYLRPNSTDHPPEEDEGPRPPDNRKKMLSFNPFPLVDRHPRNIPFGKVLIQPRSKFFNKTETVGVRFQGADPRNNLRLEGTFVAVEKWRGAGGKSTLDAADSRWTQVFSDRDWFLTYTWKRDGFLSGRSYVDVRWDLAGAPDDIEDGVYRIKYYGDLKHLFGKVKPFVGVTKPFWVGKVEGSLPAENLTETTEFSIGKAEGGLPAENSTKFSIGTA